MYGFNTLDLGDDHDVLTKQTNSRDILAAFEELPFVAGKLQEYGTKLRNLIVLLLSVYQPL